MFSLQTKMIMMNEFLLLCGPTELQSSGFKSIFLLNWFTGKNLLFLLSLLFLIFSFLMKMEFLKMSPFLNECMNYRS